MECLYSFARDARFKQRPWRKLCYRLFGVLRVITWHLAERTQRLFVLVSTMYDIFEDN
jgi:hypothetical protein